MPTAFVVSERVPSFRFEFVERSRPAAGMEPLWSPVVATGGNQRQIGCARKRRKQAKTVAVGCDRSRAKFHGKQGVCLGLPPVAGGPLPGREEVDLLKTP